MIWVPSALSAADVSVADLLNLTEGEIQPVVSGVDLAAQRAVFLKDFRTAEAFFKRGTDRMTRVFGDAAQYVTSYGGKATRGAWGTWKPYSGQMWFAPEIRRRLKDFILSVKYREPGAPLTESGLQSTKQAFQVILHENVHAFGEPADWAVRRAQDIPLETSVGRTFEEGFTELYSRRHIDDFIKGFGLPADLEKQLLDTKLETWAYKELVGRVDEVTSGLAKLAGRGQDEILDRIAKEGQVAVLQDLKKEIVDRAIAEGRLPPWSEESNNYFLAWDYIDATIREHLGAYKAPTMDLYTQITARFAMALRKGYWD